MDGLFVEPRRVMDGRYSGAKLVRPCGVALAIEILIMTAMRFGRQLTVIALCCSIGGHWFGLQSIAWATMLLKYSQHCSIKEAIVQTFDGEHPCEMCKHISKSRDNQRKSDAQLPVTKADLICVARQLTAMLPSTPYEYPELIQDLDSQARRPPSPPPRFAFV